MTEKNYIHRLFGRSRKVLTINSNKHISKFDETDVLNKKVPIDTNNYENSVITNELSTRVMNHSEDNLDTNSAANSEIDSIKQEDIKKIQGEKKNALCLFDSSIDSGVPYTILTKYETYYLTVVLALTGLCSAISMPIYWTALPDLAAYFHTTEEKINYTVTAYLCFQAVAPVFISSLSDFWGRRPVILLCLICGVAVNIALACSDTYWLVVFLRCLLASAVSPLISINSAIVGDFTTRRNRGGFSGLVSGFTLIGQGIAPFIGSVMNTVWNWRAIFWFSAALDGFVLVVVFFLLPETKRDIVGNLSVPPKSIIHRSPILWYFGKRISDTEGLTLAPVQEKNYDPWSPLLLIRKREVFLALVPCSLLFATWTISQTSMTIHLSSDYNYSSLHIGLCFFAPGSATMVGTILSGKALDIIYKKRKAKYELQYSGQDKNKIPPFNIIKTRMCLFPFACSLVCAATITFGWCLEKVVYIAVILIMSFIITFGCMYPLNVISTVLVDMFPEMSGGATALNNLFRCGMSAIFVSCLSKMEGSMTVGGTYTFMAGICFLGIFSVWILERGSENILINVRKKKMEAID